MMADVIKKMEKHCRIEQYRINYILLLISDADRESAVLLERTAAANMASMLDVCIIYNIIQAARKKSRKEYAISKIVGVVDVCLESAAASGIPAVELSKRIAAQIFDTQMPRQELDMIEAMTRRKTP